MKALVTVLNWGLGHATRSSIVIEELQSEGFDVQVASNGLALEYLKISFPNMTTHVLPARNILYSRSGNQLAKLVLSFPSFIRMWLSDRHELRKLHRKHQFDLLVSDNRPGCFVDGISNIYITHQIQVKAGAFGKMATWLHQKAMKQYDQVWIPDQETEKLAGALSVPLTHSRYIGWLSRAKTIKVEKEFDVLFLLSGPEPQRTLLEEKLVNLSKEADLKCALVRGTDRYSNDNNNISSWGLVGQKQLDELVSKSDIIVCRSGYSSIMDLIKWKKPCVLIPTPGQTEQEYLATHLSQNWGVSTSSQSDLDLHKALEGAVSIPLECQGELLHNAICDVKKTLVSKQ